jgi:hypothetical protein
MRPKLVRNHHGTKYLPNFLTMNAMNCDDRESFDTNSVRGSIMQSNTLVQEDATATNQVMLSNRSTDLLQQPKNAPLDIHFSSSPEKENNQENSVSNDTHNIEQFLERSFSIGRIRDRYYK